MSCNTSEEQLNKANYYTVKRRRTREWMLPALKGFWGKHFSVIVDISCTVGKKSFVREVLPQKLVFDAVDIAVPKKSDRADSDKASVSKSAWWHDSAATIKKTADFG